MASRLFDQDENAKKDPKGPIKKKPGNVLILRPKVLHQPLRCLTSVFGMGTGVPTVPSSPDFFVLLFVP